MSRICLIIILSLCGLKAYATGEPSTYFNIFVPPNNDPVQRNACLIVTAIYDSTLIDIIDDDMDGDNDDSYSGMLMAGQSYVLYIKDNGINDDALYASGGVLKQDGDYFIITSNNLVYASQSTDSDWQHDWVPSINKSSLGEKFIIFTPNTSYSNRDLNVFAYSDSTTVTVRDISVTTSSISGLTNVDQSSQTIAAQFTLDIGEDIIHLYSDGRDLLQSGHTYVIESNKPVTVQYGALHVNARDGGGYVPSSNGSSSGELFYFAVPYQASKEQEIRIVSWDDANAVNLSRYDNSSNSWISLENWILDSLNSGDWVGEQYNATYATTFRITCTTGKSVSVFEANWMETGSPGTSDMATMVSSESGNTAGKSFLVYMAPPGKEQNVVDPFTGNTFGQNLTHLYLFARDSANVTVKDAYSDGNVINRTYSIAPDRYVDCYLTLNEWKSIYNGDGNPNSGPERPYLLVESDAFISVMNTNFNDNWMMYFGSSQEQSFDQSSTSSSNLSAPGDTIEVVSQIEFETTTEIVNAEVEVKVGDGMSADNSTFRNVSTNESIEGDILDDGSETIIHFDSVPDLDPNNSYEITTRTVMQVNYNDGSPISDNTVINVETIVSGEVNGQYQQSVSTEGIENDTENTTNLLFTEVTTMPFTADVSNTWTSNWVDFNNDGYDDLLICDYATPTANRLFLNDGNGTFSEFFQSSISDETGGTVSATCADVDNDDDKDIFFSVNLGSKSDLILNDGYPNYTFTKLPEDDPTEDAGYHHSSSFVDYDNDGNLDLFVTDFMTVSFNQLYHGNGDGTFTEIIDQPMTQDAGRSIGASWCDYNNDGLQDLYVPQGNGQNNCLYKNLGGGAFEKITNDPSVSDSSNSVGSAWGDYDNDGFFDLFVATSSNRENLLFRNNGDGSFSKINAGDIVNDTGFSHGCKWADVDNDGWIDLYVTNDSSQVKCLYINNGDGSFTKNTNEVITAAISNARGAAFSDYDRDGDLDLFMGTHSDQLDRFFTNNGNNNNWWGCKLKGTNSNRSAIGASISIKYDGTWQHRQVNSQSGFGGQSSLLNNFGLGDGTSTLIDTVIVKWPSGYQQVLSNVAINIYSVIVEENAALLTGKVFHDENNDCYNTNEIGISGIKITATPGNTSTYTKQNGDYQIWLAPGSYQISSEPTNYWDDTCYSSLSVQLNTVADQSTNNDFPFKALANGYDLRLSMGSTDQRKGFQNDVNIVAENIGTSSVDGAALEVNFSDRLIPMSADPQWDTIIANTCYWNLPLLGPSEKFQINLLDSVSTDAEIDEFFVISGSLGPVLADLNPTDNSIDIEGKIVGAVDPNDILVFPTGQGSRGYVDFDQRLRYRIRFQNVGNYPAQYVQVINKFPDYLDPSTLRLEGESHQAEFTIVDNELKWYFNDIFLPDSTTDLEGSNGYVEFSALPYEWIDGGTIIESYAQIKFDFENYIQTNYVINTIKPRVTGHRHLLIYPNPGSEMVQVMIPKDYYSHSDLTVVDMLGREVWLPKYWDGDMCFLDVSKLGEGVYLFEIMIDGERIAEQFVKRAK